MGTPPVWVSYLPARCWTISLCNLRSAYRPVVDGSKVDLSSILRGFAPPILFVVRRLVLGGYDSGASLQGCTNGSEVDLATSNPRPQVGAGR
jgi:hypothetical protein